MPWLKPDLYRFKTGARRHVLRKLIEMGESLQNERLVQLAREALEINQNTGQLEMTWDNQKKTRSEASSGAVATDNDIDKTLSSLKDVLDAKATMATESRERRLAREMREALFAAGVHTITSMRFGEQHARVADILDRIDREFTEHAEALGLEALLESLTELNEKFGRQIELAEVDEVSYDEVQASRAEGREAFHNVLFAVCGDYADDPETRRKLMAPVKIQNERIGRYIGRQTEAPDVDPDSGEPTDPTGPDARNDGGSGNDDPTDGQPDGDEPDGEPTDAENNSDDPPDEET